MRDPKKERGVGERHLNLEMGQKRGHEEEKRGRGGDGEEGRKKEGDVLRKKWRVKKSPRPN